MVVVEVAAVVAAAVAVAAAVGMVVQTWEVKEELWEVSNHYNLLHILHNLHTGSQNLLHPVQIFTYRILVIYFVNKFLARQPMKGHG
mgnify:CR=1 FL=1